jgi:phosphoglycolate phosphatase
VLAWVWTNYSKALLTRDVVVGESQANVFLDLDGTLTDPGLGITNCIVYALQHLGTQIPSAAELRKCVGPPLRQGFASLLGTTDETIIQRAIGLYRERFTDIGLYENTLYADTLDSLQRLVAAGHRLFVATSKPTIYATRIVEHFGIDRYLARVYGSELSGARAEKAELLNYLLAAERITPDCAVMVGDRHHDVFGARANGVASIGVLWGYGDREELHQADHLVDTWPALLECVYRQL